LLDRSKLKGIRESLYGVTSSRLTVDDFPDSFRLNRIFVEPIEFRDKKKISAAYEELGMTPQVVEYFIEHGTLPNSEHVVVDILRARQLAESFKVPDIVEMAADLIEQHNSVVIFVNFRESALALATALNCPVVQGGQSAIERQKIIDAFQRDELSVIVVNIAAGGTGLSLHDVNGVRARVALISPTFNAKDYLQVLGRIHRNGAKSDAVQKVLVAAGSIEESVMKAVTKRIENLKMLHGE
jgi:superfamily II DNA or RNA helicase